MGAASPGAAPIVFTHEEFPAGKCVLSSGNSGADFLSDSVCCQSPIDERAIPHDDLRFRTNE